MHTKLHTPRHTKRRAPPIETRPTHSHPTKGSEPTPGACKCAASRFPAMDPIIPPPAPPPPPGLPPGPPPLANNPPPPPPPPQTVAGVVAATEGWEPPRVPPPQLTVGIPPNVPSPRSTPHLPPSTPTAEPPLTILVKHESYQTEIARVTARDSERVRPAERKRS